jgi:hypothetical protein
VKAHTVIQNPPGFIDWLDDLALVADEGTARLEKAWKTSKAEYRQHLTSTDPQKWALLKARAGRVVDEVVR